MMAQKNKTDIDEERARLAEAAEQLKKAADILGTMPQSSEASASENRSAKPKSASSSKSSTAKKPQTAKAPAKKTSAQNAGKSAAKKPAAKKAETADKPTAKKPAAKKAPAKKAEPTDAPADEPPTEQKPTEPVAAAPDTATVTEESPKEERVEETPPEPTAEVPKEEPAAEAAPEPTAEAPKEDPARIPCPNCGASIPAHAAFCNSCGAKVDEPSAVPVAPENEPKKKQRPAPAKEAAATDGRKRGVAAKTNDFIKNKGKLPIFIIVNALFFVAAIVLLFAAYEDKNGVYNVFQYFSNANGGAIKAFLVEQSTGWGGGAYTMLGILMIVAAIVPLALIIKNVVILCVKKDKSVYRLDAIIAFAAMLFYISMVNLFGAYIAAGPIVALIITALIFVFIVIAQLVERTDKPLPIYSFVTIPLIAVALLTFTFEVYTGANGNKAWCASAASSDITGPALFVFMLIAVVALVAMLVLQMKSIRGIVGKIIDTLIALDLMGFAVLSLAMAGGSLVLMESNPDNISLHGSFVVGGVLAILLAISWLLFTWIRPLNRVKHTLDTSEEPARVAAVEQPAPAAEQPSVAETQAAPQAEETPEEVVEYEFCRKCGTKNVVGTKFCKGCGAKID